MTGQDTDKEADSKGNTSSGTEGLNETAFPEPEDIDTDTPPEADEYSEERTQQILDSNIDGLKIILGSRLIILAPLRLEDFPLTRVLVNSNFNAPTEYQSLMMAKLINSILARSKFSLEETEILKLDRLKTYHVIGLAIEKALFKKLTD